MITKEELGKQLKVISQNAWKAEMNVTINSMVEWIVRETFEQVLFPYLEDLEFSIAELQVQLTTLESALEESHKLNENKFKDLEHGKNGRVPQPKRDAKANGKGARNGTEEAGASPS